MHPCPCPIIRHRCLTGIILLKFWRLNNKLVNNFLIVLFACFLPKSVQAARWLLDGGPENAMYSFIWEDRKKMSPIFMEIHKIWIMYRTGYSAFGHVAVKPDHRRQTNRMLVWQLRNCNVFSQIHVPRQRTKIKQDCDQHMCCLSSMLGRNSKGNGDHKNNTSDPRWLYSCGWSICVIKEMPHINTLSNRQIL